MGAVEWRPVVGFESHYRVSSEGQVWTLHARGEGRLLRGSLRSDGYPTFQLRAPGKRATVYLHRIVADAFLGPLPAGLVTMHLDGDRLNARVENLAYGTVRENVLDTVRHGMHPCTIKTHCVNGHEFTPENTYLTVKRSGRHARICRACNCDAQRRRAMRRAAPAGGRS